jgi:hypothetical protein
MKKYFVLLVAFLALTAGNAFAAATIAVDANPDTGGGTLSADAPATAAIAKMSKGVMVTARTSLTGYSLYTAHLNGSKAYGSAHDSTAIYNQEIADPGALATPGLVGEEEFATNWTAL